MDEDTLDELWKTTLGGLDPEEADPGKTYGRGALGGGEDDVSADGPALTVAALYSVYTDRMTELYPRVAPLVDDSPSPLVRETAGWVAGARRRTERQHDRVVPRIHGGDAVIEEHRGGGAHAQVQQCQVSPPPRRACFHAKHTLVCVHHSLPTTTVRPRVRKGLQRRHKHWRRHASIPDVEQHGVCIDD